MLVGKKAKPSSSKGLELHLALHLIFKFSYGPEPRLPSLDLQDSRLDLGPAAAVEQPESYRDLNSYHLTAQNIIQQFGFDSFLESDEARTQDWVQIVAKSARAYFGVLNKSTGSNKDTGC